MVLKNGRIVGQGFADVFGILVENSVVWDDIEDAFLMVHSGMAQGKT